MGNKDGVNKDLDKVSGELAAFKAHVKDVIKPGIKNSDEVAERKGRNKFLYKLHKRSAYVKEWYFLCSRTNSYLFFLRLVTVWPLLGYLSYHGAKAVGWL